MNFYFRRFVSVGLVFAWVLSCRAAWADSIDVTFSISGTSGNYDLDFTVTNNLTSIPTEDVYLFGVQIDQTTISHSPTGYADYGSWNNHALGLGGSSITYNDTWMDSVSFNHLLVGTSLSGFTIHSTAVVAPTVVNWFAFSTNLAVNPQQYTAGGNFYESTDFRNVGFEGTATGSPLAAVPEPGTFSLISLGGVGWFLYACRQARTKMGRVTGA